MTIGNYSAVAIGSEFQVNDYTSVDQTDPSITSLSDGGYVITWASDFQDGHQRGIYAQRYDSSGAVVGGEFLVNTFTTTDQYEPNVTSLANGGFIVTWTSHNQDLSSGGIYGQRYDSTGAVDGGEFRINTRTISSQAGADVTLLSDGGIVVTWHSYLQDGNNWGVFGQRYDSSGVASGGEFQINTVTDNIQQGPSIAALENGGFIVTWYSHLQDGSGYGIYGQRYDANGDADGVEFQVNTYTTTHQLETSVASLLNGGFVVTWHSLGQDASSYGIHGQRYDNNGAADGVEFQVNTYTSASQNNPVVTSMADGGFIVTWQSTGQDAGTTGIYGQRYDSNGAVIGDEFQINTDSTYNQSSPDITTLENGGFVVTWEADDQDGADFGIFAQQFKAQLFGTADNDTVVDTVGANWLNGQGGRDVLKGKGGADTIFGGGGKDKLYGDKGNDTLKGGGGADKLFGGAGKDKMFGGAGADTFVFKAASDSKNNSKADVIKDFESGVDHINLAAILTGATFIGSAGFAGAGPAEVRAVSSATETIVRIDVDGNGSADMKIILDGVTSVTVDDFIL